MASTSRAFSAPDGRVPCPCCGQEFGPREILRHVNNQHAPCTAITSAQLSSIGAVLCECGKVQSASGKGKHACLGTAAVPGPRRKRPRSAGGADRALAADWALPASAPQAEIAALFSQPLAGDPAGSAPLPPVTAMEGIAEALQGPPEQGAQQPPVVGQPAVPGPAPVAQIRYAASTVPHKAQAAFAEVSMELLRRVISTAGTPDTAN